MPIPSLTLIECVGLTIALYIIAALSGFAMVGCSWLFTFAIGVAEGITIGWVSNILLRLYRLGNFIDAAKKRNIIAPCPGDKKEGE